MFGETTKRTLCSGVTAVIFASHTIVLDLCKNENQCILPTEQYEQPHIEPATYDGSPLRDGGASSVVGSTPNFVS